MRKRDAGREGLWEGVFEMVNRPTRLKVVRRRSNAATKTRGNMLRLKCWFLWRVVERRGWGGGWVGWIGDGQPRKQEKTGEWVEVWKRENEEGVCVILLFL